LVKVILTRQDKAHLIDSGSKDPKKNAPKVEAFENHFLSGAAGDWGGVLPRAQRC
jgi:hypothetical protein